jgi:hypothetical protein
MYSAFFLLLRIRATPGLMNAEHRRIRATPGLMNAEHGRIQPFGPPHPGYARTERNTEYMDR